MKALPNLSRTASKNRVNKVAVSAMPARSGPAEALSPVPDSPAIFNCPNPTLWDLPLSSIFSRWTEPRAPGRVPPWRPRPFSPRQHQPRTHREKLCPALFTIFWNAYPCACPPCLLAFHDLSYLIIHNTDHPHMLINIRNTGHNNRPRLSLPARATATIFWDSYTRFRGCHPSAACKCPWLACVPGFHASLPSTISHTSQFTTSTAVPCSLTLDIQGRILFCIVASRPGPDNRHSVIR